MMNEREVRTTGKAADLHRACREDVAPSLGTACGVGTDAHSGIAGRAIANNAVAAQILYRAVSGREALLSARAGMEVHANAAVDLRIVLIAVEGFNSRTGVIVAHFGDGRNDAS